MANLCRTVGSDADLTATEAVARISRNDLTAEALVRACLDRIAEIDDQVQAFAYLDPDLAIRQAQAVDSNGADRVIRGVPFGMPEDRKERMSGRSSKKPKG